MKGLSILALIIISIIQVFADNPIIKNIGMSDPHIRVFNDTVYLFSGHDEDPDDRLWVMREWRVFSTTDLINWKQETIISTKDNYMPDNSKDCWAGDAISRNGKYYFYFSDQKRSIGVMTSNSAGGHYKDALGKPLVAPMHDPTIFVDDDQNETPYLIYGDKAGPYHIAKLNEDMISLAEQPKPIRITGKQWQNAPKWMDKNYLFKKGDTFYLSWGRDYATSKDVYGPYVCAGSVGTGHHLDEFAHGSFFEYRGQFYHIWTYYLRPGYKYRESIISYCHFNKDGKIVTDTKFLDKHFETGVGQYNATWPRIEAEWYSEKSKEIKKIESSDNEFHLTNIKNGSWVCFRNMEFGESSDVFSADISNITGNGKIEVRLDNINGDLIGVAYLPSITIKRNSIQVSCDLTKVSGKHDVFIKFKGGRQPLLDLNYIVFKPTEQTVNHYMP